MDGSHKIYSPKDAEGLGNTGTDYIQPYQIASGTMRGTQNVGTGVVIDSSNNRILIKQDSLGGSVTVGRLNTDVRGDQSFGLNVIDSSNNNLSAGITTSGVLATTYKDPSGFIISQATAQTHKWFDKTANIGRVAIGALPDGKYGMWVSKTGIDVSVATPAQLVFNSNQDIFKIADQTVVFLAPGTTFPNPIPAGASGTFTIQTATYNHNLQFPPATILQRYGQSVGSYSAGSTGIQDQYINGAGTGASGLVMANTYLFISVNATTASFTLSGTYSNSSSSNVSLPPFSNGTTYKVFFLQETAN